MPATPELPLLIPEGRETPDLSTPEGVKQFKEEFIANAAQGRNVDRLRYFQDLLILDANGVLEQDPKLQAAVINSGQDPLIWEGVYRGAEAGVNVLQNPDASPAQKQQARQNLQAYFRITELTRMDIPPNYPDPAAQQKVLQVWQDTWNSLNSWRPLLPRRVWEASSVASAAKPDSIPPGTGPAPDSEPRKLSLTEQIAELEKQVTARSIYGKFPPEVRIKDQVFRHDNFRDFTEYGDEGVGDFLGDRKVHTAVLGIIYNLLHGRRSQSPDFQEFAKQHFLMAVNIPGTPDAVLSYQFLQNWRDGQRRPASVVAMNFRLRRESAYKLLNLVREDPEAAEMFLQKAANGFEAEDPNLPKVGIPRVRAEEIVILNLGRLNPDYFNRNIYTDPRTIAEVIQDPKGQIAEIYKYSSPHGIADPNKIPL